MTDPLYCDVFCPYCNLPQEICHDDGYGYDEGKAHQQECPGCDKTFQYYTGIHYTYSVYKIAENEN